jgi:hypothetical protein
MLTVDTENQIVTAYGLDENGDYANVVRRMICSTGTASNPSPERTYTLNGDTARWCYFPKWGSHAQYWTRISSSIAFHSVIYNSPDVMDLAVSSYNALGEPASHGCIRLLVADAKWIYDNVGRGTTCIIYRGEPDPEGTKALEPPALNRSNMLPVSTPAPTPAPVYDPDALPPTPYRTLEVGSKGEDVFWLQSALTYFGYYHGSITGGYYKGTRDAVKAFQKANKLSADGKAGKLTQGKLYDYLFATPTPTPEPTPTPASTPDLLTLPPETTAGDEPTSVIITPMVTSMITPMITGDALGSE